MSRRSERNLDSIDYEEEVPDAAPASPSSRKSKSRKSKDRSSGSKNDPSQLALIFTKALPVLMKIENVLETAYDKGMPIVQKGMEQYRKLHKQLEPYGPDQIMKILTGFGMMFFGGFFITTVAVAEAFDQGGRETLIKNLKKLRDQAEIVIEANEEDDKVDEDNDGIADVKQISKSELGMRKMMLFLRSCDPNVVAESLGNVYAILMAVTATLQVKFARAVSLGAAIGNVLSKTVLKTVVPPLKEVLPEEFHKWVPPVATYICRLIGVSIAFSVNRVLATVHTAMRGARLAIDGFTEWAEARNLHYLSDGYLDDAAAFFCAALGVYGQLFVWSRLPFLIKLVMFPFTFTEWFLSMLVSIQVSRGTTTPNQQGAFQKGPMDAAGASPIPGQ